MQMYNFLQVIKHVRYNCNNLIIYLNIEVIRETEKNNYKYVYMNIKLFEKFVAKVKRGLDSVTFFATYYNWITLSP